MPEDGMNGLWRNGYACGTASHTVAMTVTRIQVTEAMIDRTEIWYRDHWADNPEHPREWHRAYLEAALNP